MNVDFWSQHFLTGAHGLQNAILRLGASEWI
jgi:hypothetical protein